MRDSSCEYRLKGLAERARRVTKKSNTSAAAKTTALALAAVAVSACEYDPPGITIHPTPANALAEPIMVTADSVPEGLAPRDLGRWLAARDQILDSRLALRLGSEEEGPELFSEVRAARLDGMGRLFVLDDHTQEIRVFSSEGEHLTTFGGTGDGPEEMRSGMDISVSHDGGRVWAFGIGWYKVFTKGEDGTYKGSGQSHIPVPAGGFSCRLAEDRIVVSGVTSSDSEHTLHEVAMDDGNMLRSFGASYESTSPLVRMLMSVVSPVACDPVRGMVAHAFESLPYVRAFGPNGEMLWGSQIEDFEEMFMIQRVDEFGRDTFGQQGARAGVGYYDTNKGLSLYGDGYLVWQVRRTLASERPGTGTIRTYLLDIDSGRGALISNGGIPLIVGMAEERFVATAGELRPRLEVWTIGEGH